MAEIEGKSSEENQEFPTDHDDVLQRLYAELEHEREASATAISETLSMILRLQEEKALENMEAFQYKRVVEERMHHDGEMIATMEELLHHKDVEIASLRSQLKLLRDRGLNSELSIPSFFEIDEFQRDQHLPSFRVYGMCCETDSLEVYSGGEMREESQPRGHDEKYKHDESAPVSCFSSSVDNSPPESEMEVAESEFGIESGDKTMDISVLSCSPLKANGNNLAGFHDIFEVPLCKDGSSAKGCHLCSHTSTVSREDGCGSNKEFLRAQSGTVVEPKGLYCNGTLKDLQIGEAHPMILATVQLKLINDISENLCVNSSQVKRSPPKKYVSLEDSSVVSYMEVSLPDA